MRNISSGLATHLQQSVTTLAVCWKIKRSDGTILGFTTAVSNITYNLGDGDGSILYEAKTGVSPSQIKSSAGSGVDSISALGIINSVLITDTDMLSGRYDNAKVTIFFVNYANLSDGHCILLKGYIGDIKVTSTSFEVDIRSLSQRLSQQIGKVCSPTCMVKDFGDSECTINLASHTFSASVTTQNNRQTFAASALNGQATHAFRAGKIIWTSGLNNGLKEDVKDNTTGTGVIELALPMPFNIVNGDTFNIIHGCDRLFATCKLTYNNVVNFRGFPHMPGTDAVLRIIPG